MARREHIPARLRHEVFKRDNYRCRECGATNKETTLEIDHIVPVSKGGSNSLSNLQTLCKKCNRAKHARTWVGGETDSSSKRNKVKEIFKPDYTARRYSEEYWNLVNKGVNESISSEDSRANTISYFKQAVEVYKKYRDHLCRIGIHAIDYKPLPKAPNVLPERAIQICSKIHLEYEISAISENDKQIMKNVKAILRKKDVESILRASGQDNIISQNQKLAENKTKDHIQNLRRKYYEKISFANQLVDSDSRLYFSAKWSINQYKYAINLHKEYFNSQYKKYDGDKYSILPQPPERFTDEAIHYLLILYKKTHPLSSSKSDVKVNSEISKMLMELHESDLKKVDDELKAQIRRKKFEKEKLREQRIEKVNGIITDTYAAANIAASKLGNLFKK